MKNRHDFKRFKRVVRAGAMAMTVTAAVACSKQTFEQPPEAQSFAQQATYSKEVDVLFVTDTSSSMTDHQKALGGQIGILIDAFNKTGLDYQMAVTSMDMSSQGEKGRFLAQPGTPAILDKNTKNLAPILGKRMAIGTYGGHPLPRGLEAMKAALTASSDATSVNAGFLRKDALLVVIFLTISDDRSILFNYQAWLDELRPKLANGERSWVVQFLGVTPDDPSCRSTTWNYQQPGHAYIALAKASGGAVESICDGDWLRAVVGVKARILEVMTEYPLKAPPIESTIVVTVNGVVVPRDEVDGWTYIAERNAIRFHGASVPAVDAVIDVVFDRNGLK